ncbi:hypothetical protein H4S02_010969, partial [Coemansia sp. RSA 2611]
RVAHDSGGGAAPLDAGGCVRGAVQVLAHVPVRRRPLQHAGVARHGARVRQRRPRRRRRRVQPALRLRAAGAGRHPRRPHGRPPAVVPVPAAAGELQLRQGSGVEHPGRV